MDWEEEYKKETGMDASWEEDDCYGVRSHTVYRHAYINWLEEKLDSLSNDIEWEKQKINDLLEDHEYTEWMPN
jgi:hypothetical protein